MDLTTLPTMTDADLAGLISQANAIIAQREQAAATEATTLRGTLAQVISDVNAEIARCDAILAKTAATITGADTKDAARATKRVAFALRDLVKIIQQGK